MRTSDLEASASVGTAKLVGIVSGGLGLATLVTTISLLVRQWVRTPLPYTPDEWWFTFGADREAPGA